MALSLRLPADIILDAVSWFHASAAPWDGFAKRQGVHQPERRVLACGACRERSRSGLGKRAVGPDDRLYRGEIPPDTAHPRTGS